MPAAPLWHEEPKTGRFSPHLPFRGSEVLTTTRRMLAVPTYNIRVFGDPVLRQRAREVENVDGRIVRLAEDMIDTMHAAPGVGLAATQVGIERRLFVYDVGDGPQTIVNPTISEARGEWEFEEGCLSVPGLHWNIVRPKEVHLSGYDLDGNEILDRGRRVPCPRLPARARPPRRRPPAREAAAGRAQGGHADPALPRPRRGRPRAGGGDGAGFGAAVVGHASAPAVGHPPPR